MPVIWLNSQFVQECSSDLAELSVCGQCASDFLAELPVAVIWQNCLSVDSVPVIWQNCLYVEERASDLAEFAVPVIWQRRAYMWRSMPVIWQNCLCHLFGRIVFL